MSKKLLFPKTEVCHKEYDAVYFNDVDITTVAEKIVDDIRTVKLDTDEKVNKVKERVAQILRFYKWHTEKERKPTIADKDMEDLHYSIERGVRKSMSSLYNKAKLDAAVIRLQDRATTQETKQEIQRQVVQEGFNSLKDKTEEELRRIDDQTKILTATAKSAVEECLQVDRPHGWGRASLVGSKLYCPRGSSPFEEVDGYTQRMIEKTKFNVRENVQVLLTNPAGKKMEEEIESEKFIVQRITDLRKKVQNDLRSQKGVLDRSVKRVKEEADKLMPFQYYHDDEEEQ